MICDWSDEENCLIHYGLLKFHVRHGMIIEKIHDVISFRHSKWLKKNIYFNTQKRNHDVNDFEKKNLYFAQ